MNEWTRCWIIVNWTEVHRIEDGRHFAIPDGRKYFHIHDARHHQHLLGDDWQIWHWTYANQPEEWVGDPWHFMVRGTDRHVKPENFEHVGYVIPDHVPMPHPDDYQHKTWHWKHPETIEYLKTLKCGWVHPPEHPPAHILKR
jgi:hypothetical protein